LHVLLLLAVNLTFMQGARVSVAMGDAPMEISLIASKNAKQERSTLKRVAVSENGEIALKKRAEEAAEEQSSAVGTESGRGSSTVARPNYFNNPAPVYPERARQLGQEGTVLLAVEVNAEGRVNRLSVKQTSGFSSLDQAAMRAVRNWVFEPARIGGVAVASSVNVPVSFNLKRETI
jgi:protein TonB